MEGGAGPTQQGNPLASLLGDVAERFADHAVFFEVVMFTDQAIPLAFLLRGSQIDSDFITCEFVENLGDQMRWGRSPVRFTRSNHALSMARAEGFVQSIIPTRSSRTP